MKKLRLISILLAMALVFTLMPAIALADESDADSDGGTSESTSDVASDSADDADTGDTESAGDTTEVAEDETPAVTEDEAPAVTDDETPAVTDDETPAVTEDEIPAVTEDETPAVTEDETPAVIEDGAPAITEDETTGEIVGNVIGDAAVGTAGEINAAQSVMLMSLMDDLVPTPAAPVEPQSDKDATAEKNMDWANSLRVDFYLRLDDQQAINVKDNSLKFDGKPDELTSATDKNDYKTGGYSSVLATGKLGDSLAYYFAGGNGTEKYQSVLASDYNGGSFKLDDFKLDDDQKAKLEGLGNVEWYVAKAYDGKINVDGIIVPIKTEEKEPVVIYDGGDDDGDDDGYYALVAIDDEGVPLAVAPVEPAAAVFIMDEEVPLANLPQTGSSAAATAAAAGVAIIMIGVAMLCKKEH